MSEHTPGPWYNIGLSVYRDGEACFDLARASITPREGEDSANARLIAAAPDLLEACIQARAALPDAWAAVKCDVPREVIELLNAAIAKAGGENRENRTS